MLKIGFVFLLVALPLFGPQHVRAAVVNPANFSDALASFGVPRRTLLEDFSDDVAVNEFFYTFSSGLRIQSVRRDIFEPGYWGVDRYLALNFFSKDFFYSLTFPEVIFGVRFVLPTILQSNWSTALNITGVNTVFMPSIGGFSDVEVFDVAIEGSSLVSSLEIVSDEPFKTLAFSMTTDTGSSSNSLVLDDIEGWTVDPDPGVQPPSGPTVPPPAAVVPLPPAALLMLSALGGLLALRSQRGTRVATPGSAAAA